MSTEEELWAVLRHVLGCRSGSRCECCGRPLDDGSGRWEAHHRLLRKQGGGHVLSNLLALRIDCHDRAHDEPTVAYERGLLVHAGITPATVPVVHRSGRTYLLDDYGHQEVTGWTPQPPQWRAA